MIEFDVRIGVVVVVIIVVLDIVWFKYDKCGINVGKGVEN